MTNENEPIHKRIRLTDDGELWGLPMAENVLEEKRLQQQEASERQRLALELQTSQERTMEHVMTRLRELNSACDNKLFFELVGRTNDNALISRTIFTHQIEGEEENVCLVISKHGFHAMRFISIDESKGYEQWTNWEAIETLKRILDPGSILRIDQQGIGFGEKDARIFAYGKIGKDLDESFNFSAHYLGDAPLLTQDDESLIQACLERSLAPLQEERNRLQKEAEEEELALSALEKQVGLAQNIQSILPEPVSPAYTVDSETSSGWLRGRFQKKKKKENKLR